MPTGGCLPFTWAKPVGLQFSGTVVSKILDVSSKFRTGIAFTICTNQFHLPENGREYATCTSPIIHLICLA